mgnify:CR=1 FL=1
MKLHDDVHNYYENLVVHKLQQMNINEDTKEADYLADLCCLVLNQLPPRYIRYEVDMAFYMPQAERLQMEMNVDSAIRSAIKFLHERDNR